jgi:hypothetical protein
MKKRHRVPPARTIDRRQFLARSAATAAIAISGSALIHTTEAWGLEVTNLRPETMRTLVKVARDIYPHDRLADRYYAIAVKAFDEKAGTDSATKILIEDGIGNLDMLAKNQHGLNYIDVGWEAQRAALLAVVATSTFFQTVHSSLVVSLYNQKEIWPLFGYEGESASKGGYINRGFNDVTWL